MSKLKNIGYMLITVIGKSMEFVIFNFIYLCDDVFSLFDRKEDK